MLGKIVKVVKTALSNVRLVCLRIGSSNVPGLRPRVQWKTSTFNVLEYEGEDEEREGEEGEE